MCSSTMTLDEVTFVLQEPHNFEWLKSLGRVFCVFDQQDSGNISFGVDTGERKLFVKYAGAIPIDFDGNPQDAIFQLSEAAELYTVLRHPALIQLVEHFSIESGYALVFEWFSGECLHPHWSFPPPAKYEHPDSPFYRFRQLPLRRRLASIDALFMFIQYVESKGYVAVDLYDGSILYDFSQHITKMCDIDLFRKAPSVNDIGEGFWGSTRFKAPEEYELGATIDAKTNVYTLGALAFALLGGETNRDFSKWDGGEELYVIAQRAVQQDPALRYSSVHEMKAAWDLAKESS